MSFLFLRKRVKSSLFYWFLLGSLWPFFWKFEVFRFGQIYKDVMCCFFMAGDFVDRCPTGIVGFDKLCMGGFVRNSDNLVVGGPGSGKSTFMLQFLWNGATMYGENGLYCSFEPDIVDTLNDAHSHGWDFTKLSEEGKIKFMRFAPQTSIEDLKAELTRIISKNGIRRICFDPISVLALNLADQGKIRQKIFELSTLMKRLRVTTVFVDESMEADGMTKILDGEWTKTDILAFLSDSVTLLYDSSVAGVGDRAIRITKMRRTPHVRMAAGMTIRNEGIKVYDTESNAQQVAVV
jgi:circadian clock protein KaiC